MFKLQPIFEFVELQIITALGCYKYNNIYNDMNQNMNWNIMFGYNFAEWFFSNSEACLHWSV